jgi:SNF2 family DNA or RNA helicase
VIHLADGRLLTLPIERVRGIINTLVELYDNPLQDDGKLRLNTLQAAQLSELETSLGAQAQWHGGKQLRELGKRLQNFAGIEAVAVPADFHAQLRPYQQQGVNWLQFLREYSLGGILADDMGLGKTVQTLAHLLIEKAQGRMDRPSLVIAPTSLMYNWRMEAERFTPNLRVLVLHGTERKRHFKHLNEYDLLLTTYPLLPRDIQALLAQEYHYVILDEAQNIKNPKAQASKIVRQLNARHRLCLTGTPMENHLGEIWSLFDFLMPKLLGDEKQFRRLFRTPIEKHADQKRQHSLNTRIAPFLLRRSKQEVVKELPPKTEIIQNIELHGPQRDLYESIRLAMHEKVRNAINKNGVARSHIIILEALLKLRQVCCDPRLVKLDSAKKVKASAKMQLLMDMLPEQIEEGRRILLFSQFTSMLSLIEEELHKHKIDYVKLTGATKARDVPIQRFQNGDVPLFLISLKAGGTGLNLTAADTVIHYDPWWNPAVENQATDRAHRIGQNKSVFVYKLITSGTVEDKILALQARKKELADNLFSDSGKGASALTQADLNALFEPLA